MAAILIVEDRPTDRRVLATMLTSAGHTVTEASDGAEGLRLAERHPPDLVISDILMPTVDGFEFVRRLHGVASLAHTPVIFYTAAYHEREARALAQQCGVGYVLTKPSDYRTILALVDTALAPGKPPPPPVQESAQFSRDQLRAVSSALRSKIVDFEASEQRMAAIISIAHEIAAEHAADVLLAKVCAAAREVTLAQYAIITLLTEDGLASRRVATSGLAAGALERMTVAALDGAAFTPVITERRAVRIQNPDGRPEAIGLPANHPLTHSWLALPIASPGRVFGCLELRNRLGADGFTDRDEGIALALATHAGIAYENARLYDDLRRRSAALEQEVADRRRAEATLRTTGERTQLALTAARMGVWEHDLTSGRIEWSNSLATTFGLSPAQSPTTLDEFSALIHPDDRAAAAEGIARAIHERTDFVNEFRTVWPDGTVHWIAGRARLLSDEHGSPTRIIGVGMDVSERKSLEDQLRQALKMEAIGQLAGGVAHDFNNLVTVIHGYAELLLTTLEVNDPRRTDVGEILKAGERAARLTRQLLAFSRKQILQPTLIDVSGLVTSTIEMLRRLIGADIELVTTLAPAPAAVHADAGQLVQILMNLAMNARDAMPHGGRLSIETSHVVLDDWYAVQHVGVEAGPYVLLSVTDTGIGMDAATRARIFEPFFTTKEVDRGTGLGLSTVYGIVTQSGAHIRVYSEPGHGAAIKVYFPRAEEAAVADRPVDHVEAAPTGWETVLLVEDEQAVRFLARLLLERAGYQVLEAADPREAEELFRQSADPIDLLITDVILPGSSGPSLFARLSAQQPSLKVLYMSGYPDGAIAHHGGLSPDVVFLQKPFTTTGLLCKARESLDR